LSVPHKSGPWQSTNYQHGAGWELTDTLGDKVTKAPLDLVSDNRTADGFGNDETRLRRLKTNLGGLREVHHYAASAGAPSAAHRAGEVPAPPKPVCCWQHVAP
jgi:hypothetical protein